MRQLTLTAPSMTVWQDVDEPDLQGDAEALVRPLAVARCDLDRPMALGEVPFALPIALGHEGVARVLAVGSAVTTLSAGDVVVVPFQISCGNCGDCGRDQTAVCTTTSLTASYGFGAFGGDAGGLLSDVVRVPYADAMLVAIPDGVDPLALASASDNLPDAYRAVAPFLMARPEADVLVMGGPVASIGLYAVALAQVLGNGTVTYVDEDPARLAIAADLGAQAHTALPRRKGGWPVVVWAGLDQDSLEAAVHATAPYGDLTLCGIRFEAATPLPLLAMYTRGIHLHTGRANARPAIPALIDLVATGRLNPTRVTDRVVAWDEAAEAWTDPAIKLVVARLD